MKRWLALLIGVLLTPLLGHAQSGAISGTAQSNNGGFSSPIGGATITVCPGASGTLTTPCASPTVSLYSDSLITMALPNPTTADGNGNFNFFVSAPQLVVISISGVGIPGYSYYYSAGAARGGGNTNPPGFPGTSNSLSPYIFFSSRRRHTRWARRRKI